MAQRPKAIVHSMLVLMATCSELLCISSDCVFVVSYKVSVLVLDSDRSSGGQSIYSLLEETW